MQQVEQLVVGIGLVGALHQCGFAHALGGVGFAVGVQAAGEFAVHLAHRLAGLLCLFLRLALFGAGLALARLVVGGARGLGLGCLLLGLLHPLLLGVAQHGLGVAHVHAAQVQAKGGFGHDAHLL